MNNSCFVDIVDWQDCSDKSHISILSKKEDMRFIPATCDILFIVFFLKTFLCVFVGLVILRLVRLLFPLIFFFLCVFILYFCLCVCLSVCLMLIILGHIAAHVFSKFRISVTFWIVCIKKNQKCWRIYYVNVVYLVCLFVVVFIF